MIVDCAYYVDGVRQQEGTLPTGAITHCLNEEHGFVWLGLSDPTDDELREAQRLFGLHELAIEDTRCRHERPKLEPYEDHQFLVLRTAIYDDEREEVEFGEINVFAGPRFVVVVREGRASSLRGTRQRLEGRPDLLAQGPGAVLWGVIDRVVDDYEPVVRGLENDVEEVEAQVFAVGTNPPDQTARIYFLKRELSDLRRALHPLLAPLDQAAQGLLPGVDGLAPYFRDVLDHVRRIEEEAADSREQLVAAMQANIALIANRQNDAVRKVTGWAALVAVPTFVASVYGMNFTHMPELDWRLGYPFAIALMIAIAGTIYWLLRRSRWI